MGDFPALLALVDRATAQAPDVLVMAALTEVAAICVKRSDGEALSEMTFKAMTARCQQYPADVVLKAIKGWPDTKGGKWFPTWNELKTELDKHGGYRSRVRGIITAAMKAQQEQAA